MLALRTGEKKVGAMIGSLTCVVIKIWMVVSPKIKMKINIAKGKTDPRVEFCLPNLLL